MARAVAGGAGGAALRARGERRRRAARAPGRPAAGGRPRPDRPDDLRPRLPHLGQPLPGRRAGRRGGAGGALPGGARARRRRLRRRSSARAYAAPGRRGARAALDGRPGPGRARPGRPTCATRAAATTPWPSSPTSTARRPTRSASWRDRALLVPTLHDEPPARLAIFRGVFDAARALIFSTEEERELARERFGVGDDRARVAGWGLDPAARRPTRRRMAAPRGRRAPYALCVGRIDLSKGVGELVEHHARYRRAVPDGLDLVLVGGGDAPLPAHPWLHRLGYVEDAVKHDALAGAAVVVRAVAVREPVARAAGGVEPRPARRWRTPPRRCWWASRAASGGGLWYRDADEYAAMLDLLASARPLARRDRPPGAAGSWRSRAAGTACAPSGWTRSRSPPAGSRRGGRRRLMAAVLSIYGLGLVPLPARRRRARRAARPPRPLGGLRDRPARALRPGHAALPARRAHAGLPGRRPSPWPSSSPRSRSRSRSGSGGPRPAAASPALARRAAPHLARGRGAGRGARSPASLILIPTIDAGLRDDPRGDATTTAGATRSWWTGSRTTPSRATSRRAWPSR